jgi:hypothetical protein
MTFYCLFHAIRFSCNQLNGSPSPRALVREPAVTTNLAQHATLAEMGVHFGFCVSQLQVTDLEVALLRRVALQAYTQKSNLLLQAIFDFKVRYALVTMLRRHV